MPDTLRQMLKSTFEPTLRLTPADCRNPPAESGTSYLCLLAAVHRADWEKASKLLSQGAKITPPEGFLGKIKPDPLLHRALQKPYSKQSEGFVQQLLHQGANPNESNQLGRSAFDVADASQDSIKWIALLEKDMQIQNQAVSTRKLHSTEATSEASIELSASVEIPFFKPPPEQRRLPTHITHFKTPRIDGPDSPLNHPLDSLPLNIPKSQLELLNAYSHSSEDKASELLSTPQPAPLPKPPLNSDTIPALDNGLSEATKMGIAVTTGGIIVGGILGYCWWHRKKREKGSCTSSKCESHSSVAEEVPLNASIPRC
jgi:hypothetical protein